MSKALNPFGLHTMTTYMIVEDVKKLIEFLSNVFEVEQREINYRDDKSVEHAEIQIGDSFLMMGEPSPKFPDVELTNCGFYLYVEDCDSTYKKALEHGGKSISEPMDYPHGDRFGGIRDFAGNTWWIVTHIGNNE